MKSEVIQIAILALNADDNQALSEGLGRAGMHAEIHTNLSILGNLSAYAGVIITGDLPADNASTLISQPILNALMQFNAMRKPILGIALGAKVLVDNGFVPGIKNNQVGLSLVPGNDQEEIVKIHLATPHQYNVFTHFLKEDQVFLVPPSHNNFIIPPGLLAEIVSQGLGVLEYVDKAKGLASSMAAISNKSGNVMAVLPKCEKTLVCDLLLQSMHHHITKGYLQETLPLFYCPPHFVRRIII